MPDKKFLLIRYCIREQKVSQFHCWTLIMQDQRQPYCALLPGLQAYTYMINRESKREVLTYIHFSTSLCTHFRRNAAYFVELIARSAGPNKSAKHEITIIYSTHFTFLFHLNNRRNQLKVHLKTIFEVVDIDLDLDISKLCVAFQKKN